MGHRRELRRTQKKLWKVFLRLSEAADFVAIERPKMRKAGDGIRRESL